MVKVALLPCKSIAFTWRFDAFYLIEKGTFSYERKVLDTKLLDS